jgi:hypothetical protein
MREFGIHGNAYHFTVLCLEIAEPPVKGQDLRGTDKSEIKGVEEEDHILSPIAGECDLTECVVGQYRLGGKIRGFLGNMGGN